MPTVNGKEFDHGDLSVEGLPGAAAAFSEVSYGDEMPVTPQFAKGRLPAGWTRGGFKGSLTLKMPRTSYDLLNAAAQALGGLYALPPFPLVLTCRDLDGAVAEVTTLPKVLFGKRDYSHGSAGSDAMAEVTMQGVYMGEPVIVPTGVV